MSQPFPGSRQPNNPAMYKPYQITKGEISSLPGVNPGVNLLESRQEQHEAIQIQPGEREYPDARERWEIASYVDEQCATRANDTA